MRSGRRKPARRCKPSETARVPGGQLDGASLTRSYVAPDSKTWPPVITPGENNGPPSDAIVLFDGKNLDEWVSNRDKSPAKWMVANGVLTVNKEKGVGNIETNRPNRPMKG